METKAHHVLIGSFVIIFMASLFGFLVWASKFERGVDYIEYDILFEESVFGLNRASSVLFNGIPVGEVKTIDIDERDPSKVRVTVKIKEGMPIQEDTVATLAMQGLTGVLSVQIKGGMGDSPPLEAKPGEERPVIPSVPSPLEEFFGGAPELLQKAGETLTRLNRILADDNIERIPATLANVETLTQALAEEEQNIRASLSSLKETLAATERMMQDDLQPAAAEFRDLSQKADDLVANLNAVIEENRGSITTFTNTALPELTLLVKDLRELSQSITSLAEQLEENPSELLFPRKDPEYEVE